MGGSWLPALVLSSVVLACCAIQAWLLEMFSLPFSMLLQGDRALDRILPRPFVQQWRELEQQV